MLLSFHYSITVDHAKIWTCSYNGLKSLVVYSLRCEKRKTFEVTEIVFLCGLCWIVPFTRFILSSCWPNLKLMSKEASSSRRKLCGRGRKACVCSQAISNLYQHLGNAKWWCVSWKPNYSIHTFQHFHSHRPACRWFLNAKCWCLNHFSKSPSSKWFAYNEEKTVVCLPRQ